jgi:phosphatidylinositol glycan class B
LRLGRRGVPPAWTIALAGVVAGSAVVRLRYGLHEHGIYWPDEIYQSIEQAHRLVYGYGLVPWEWVVGARSWAFPGLLGAVLWAGKAVGLSDPDQYLTLVRVTFVAVAGATTLGVFVLARSLGASHAAAIAGAAVFAFGAPIVYFGHRALSEPFSALPVVFGFALALAPKARTGRRLPFLAGASLLGLATVLRLQNALFCAALIGVLAARRDWRACGEAGVVLVGWALLLGLLDQLTWGSWFHSAREYIEFSVIEGGAEKGWGASPWHYYIRVLWQSMPVLTVVVGALGLAAWRRAR